MRQLGCPGHDHEGPLPRSLLGNEGELLLHPPRDDRRTGLTPGDPGSIPSLDRTEVRLHPHCGVIGCVLSVAAHPGALGEVVTNPDAAPYCAIVGGCAVLWAGLVALGIGSTPAVAAAMTFALEPVLVSLLAYAILGERLSTAQIAGGAIVVASVTLVAASPTSRPTEFRGIEEREPQGQTPE